MTSIKAAWAVAGNNTNGKAVPDEFGCLYCHNSSVERRPTRTREWSATGCATRATTSAAKASAHPVGYDLTTGTPTDTSGHLLSTFDCKTAAGTTTAGVGGREQVRGRRHVLHSRRGGRPGRPWQGAGLRGLPRRQPEHGLQRVPAARQAAGDQPVHAARRGGRLQPGGGGVRRRLPALPRQRDGCRGAGASRASRARARTCGWRCTRTRATRARTRSKENDGTLLKVADPNNDGVADAGARGASARAATRRTTRRRTRSCSRRRWR